MRALGFHASKGTVRFALLEGSALAPVLVKHERRPLQLLEDRPTFLANAKNLFSEILENYRPDRVSYLISMQANSREQVAGLILPFGALNLVCAEKDLRCDEFIAANFSKSFFKPYSIPWSSNYDCCDKILGTHTPNWTNSERLAALAAMAVL